MILVVAESSEHGLSPNAFEAVAAAQRVGRPVTVVLPGRDVGTALESLVGADVQDLVALEHDALDAYTPDGYVAALGAFISESQPAWVLSAHSYRARDFMPALAARFERGLATDCTGVRHDADGIVLTRPIFGGKLAADVVIAGPPPAFATFQVGVFGRDQVRVSSGRAVVRKAPAVLAAGRIRQRPEPRFREEKPAVDLAQADRIVAVGRGVKEKDQLSVVEALATALGAEMAASRPICDAGWMPMDRQVGSSGQTVAPKLYVAVGISGAIQHVVGMRGAKTVVAVNRDPQAPIFEVADYGIIGDLFEVVPAIVRALK